MSAFCTSSGTKISSDFLSNIQSNRLLVLLSTVGHKFSGHVAGRSSTNYLKSELDLYDVEYSRIFKNQWMLALMLTALLMIPGVLYFSGGILTSIFLLIIAILFAAMYFSRAKYSESGWLLKNNISAFKDFLSRDPDQINQRVTTDPTYFDKVFPYAVAFGLDEEFANSFRESRLDAPIWFIDDHQKSNNDLTTFKDFREQFTAGCQII